MYFSLLQVNLPFVLAYVIVNGIARDGPCVFLRDAVP